MERINDLTKYGRVTIAQLQFGLPWCVWVKMFVNLTGVAFEVSGDGVTLSDAVEDCHANIEAALSKLTKPGVFLK